MTDRDALELLNMFTTAVQIAKARNQYESHLKINEAILIEWLKKAYPSKKDSINFALLAKNILSNQ